MYNSFVSIEKYTKKDKTRKINPIFFACRGYLNFKNLKIYNIK